MKCRPRFLRIIQECIEAGAERGRSTVPAFSQRWSAADGWQMQIVTVTGQQGHNSRPVKDLIPGQKMS